MAYRVPVLEKFSWQEPVIDFVASNPGSPAKGDRYVLTGSGAISWYNGSEWKTDAPAAGWRVYNRADGTYWVYDGAAWSNVASAAGLKLNGDIDSTAAAIDWDLKANDASALSFDSTSKAGILEIVTTEGSEGVKMSGDLTIQGGLTVQGEVTYLQTTNTNITDKIVTLNKGGAAASAGGAGIEFEEGGAVTGYVKVADADESVMVIKAPTGNILSLDVNVDATLQLDAGLTVEAASAINQDVTTDASPTFAGATLNGNVSITGTLGAGNTAIAGTLGATGAVDFDSTLNVDGAATFGNTITVTGAATLAAVTATDIDAATLDLTGAATFASTIAVTGDATFSANLSDGVNAVSVANMKSAYDSRAKYDSALGVIVFDDAALELA